MQLIETKTILLLFAAAVGYAIATVGMKLTAGGVALSGSALLIAGFAAAAIAEVVLLRDASLGQLYMMIIGVETLVVLTYAWTIGEGLAAHQLAGGALVVVGVAVLAH